jgi:hypothetical protein
MAPGTLTLRTTCTGGINQNPERCRDNQVADALNVWAPNGRLEQRPGCRAVLDCGVVPMWTFAAGGITLGYEDVSAAPGVLMAAVPAGLVVGGLVARSADIGGGIAQAGDRWYVGVASATDLVGFAGGINLGTVPNASRIRAEAEYWDGFCWRELSVAERYAASATATPDMRPCVPHLGTADLIAQSEAFSFVPPGDWAASTLSVGGVATTRFWLRFSFVAVDPTGGAPIAVTAGTTLVLLDRLTLPSTALAVARCIGAVGVSVGSYKRFVRLMVHEEGVPL